MNRLIDFVEGNAVLLILFPMIFSFGVYPFFISEIGYQSYDVARMIYVVVLPLLIVFLSLKKVPALNFFAALSFVFGFVSWFSNGAGVSSFIDYANSLGLIFLIFLLPAFVSEEVHRARLAAISGVVFLVPFSLLLIDFFSDFKLSFWNKYYNNKRIYDDAIVPLIFISAGFLHYYRLKILSFVMPVCMLLVLFLDNHRAGIFAYLSVVFFMIFYRIDIFKRLSVFFLVSSFIYICYIFLSDASFNEVVRTTSSSRYELYMLSWQDFIESPVFGVGPNNFSELLLSHPHNIFWQHLVEWGFLGGGLLLLLIIKLFLLIFKNYSAINPYVLSAVLAMIVNLNLSGAMNYPSTQLLYACIFSMAISEFGSGAKFPLMLPTSPSVRMSISVLAGLWFFLVVFSAAGKYQYELGPRFWLHDDYYSTYGFDF